MHMHSSTANNAISVDCHNRQVNLFTAESLCLYGCADILLMCVNLYITYPLDFGIGLAVDEGPEHVSTEDILLALDYEKRMPEF